MGVFLGMGDALLHFEHFIITHGPWPFHDILCYVPIKKVGLAFNKALIEGERLLALMPSSGSVAVDIHALNHEALLVEQRIVLHSTCVALGGEGVEQWNT